LIEFRRFITFLSSFMDIAELFKDTVIVGRRGFLRRAAAALALVAAARDMLLTESVSAQTAAPGMPLPDESVDATLKRLFGNRPLQPGSGKIKLELPLIAEDGANVSVTIETDLPLAGATRLNHIYIISDKNRRPMLAKFTFTPESGKAFVSTSVRLAMSTDVRAIAEMSDGTLYGVAKHVRVTISGCDLPPQS
jgi:sulfur-oxidizing protein SoxY